MLFLLPGSSVLQADAVDHGSTFKLMWKWIQVDNFTNQLFASFSIDVNLRDFWL